MESSSDGLIPAPTDATVAVPATPDGTSPCQIYVDRMEDLGLQIDNLLLTLSEVDGRYRECLANHSVLMLNHLNRFENLRRLMATAKTLAGEILSSET